MTEIDRWGGKQKGIVQTQNVPDRCGSHGGGGLGQGQGQYGCNVGESRRYQVRDKQVCEKWY